MALSVNFQNLTPSGQKCGFCLSKIQDNEEVVGHQYGSHPDGQHAYHRLCTTPWFEQGRDICPLCNMQVSNVDQYIPSVWKRASRIATTIVRSGILAGAVSGIIREAFAVAIPDRISYTIAISVAGFISLKTISEIPRLSETSRFLITMGIMGGSIASNGLEIPGFGEIALTSVIIGIYAGGLSWLLRERETAASGIINLVSSGLSSGLSAMAAKVARTAIVQLPGFIAAYIANH